MKNDRRCWLLTGAMVVLLFLCVPNSANSQEDKKIAARDLPATVTASFHKAYPHAKIRGASAEEENGKTYYEVESIDGKVKRDLLYAADGTCVEIEETIAARALPADVSKSLKQDFPKAKILKAEKVTKDQTLKYELVVQSGKDQWEVAFDAAGKVVEKTKKEKKSGDDD